MPSNLYADVPTYVRRFITSSAPVDSADLDSIEEVLEDASRDVDSYCNRTFVATVEPREFDGTGRDPTNTDYLSWAQRQVTTQSMSFLRIPDLVTASEVAFDEQSSRSFSLVLDPTKDYYLLQYGARNQLQAPFNTLQLDTFNGQRTVLSGRPLLVRITGTWGYSADTRADRDSAGTPTTATLADASTAVMTTNQAGGLARGQTLVLDAEQVYVLSGSGTSWVVDRAQNGTTGALHTAAAVLRRTYPRPVIEAALIFAARRWSRRKTAFTQSIITPGGTIETYKGLDVDIPVELDTYRRVQVA